MCWVHCLPSQYRCNLGSEGSGYQFAGGAAGGGGRRRRPLGRWPARPGRGLCPAEPRGEQRQGSAGRGGEGSEKGEEDAVLAVELTRRIDHSIQNEDQRQSRKSGPDGRERLDRAPVRRRNPLQVSPGMQPFRR